MDIRSQSSSLEMAVNESTDPGYLADRLDIPQVDEVF